MKKLFHVLAKIVLWVSIICGLFVAAMSINIIIYDFFNSLIVAVIAVFSVVLVYGILESVSEALGRLESIQHSLETLAAAKETNETTTETDN